MSKHSGVKLTKKEARLIEVLREGNKNVYISRFSSNVGICGTDTYLPNSVLESLINKEILEYSHESDIHNFYTLTTTGREVDLK